jgi:hypothetical protein
MTKIIYNHSDVFESEIDKIINSIDNNLYYISVCGFKHKKTHSIYIDCSHKIENISELSIRYFQCRINKIEETIVNEKHYLGKDNCFLLEQEYGIKHDFDKGEYYEVLDNCFYPYESHYIEIPTYKYSIKLKK